MSGGARTDGHRTVEVDGVRLAYLEYGLPDGPMVLCLHGFPDSPVTFRHLAARLAAEDFRVVTPWLRGYPPSAVVNASYQVARLARDAVALAEALAPGQPAWLVGHDWGGLVAYGAAALEPSRWNGIVVLSVPPTRMFRPFLRRDWDQQRASWYQFLFQLEGLAEDAVSAEDFRFLGQLWRSWSPGWEIDKESFDAARASIRAGFPASLRYYRDAWQLASQDPLLAEDQRRIVEGPIEVPALVLRGQQDGCILAGAFSDMAGYFSAGHTLEELPDVGHFLHLETPSLVNDRILAFLHSRGRGPSDTQTPDTEEGVGR